MKKYIPILLSIFIPSYTYASWNEHFVKYTCLPEVGLFQIERLSVESPDNLYGTSGLKPDLIETLRGKGIYSIAAGAHEYSCSINAKNVVVVFEPKSYRQNWLGGLLTLKVGDKYIAKNVDFFWGTQSLSRVRIAFKGSDASVNYWSDVASENDIFGYIENDFLLSSGTQITRAGLIKKHGEPAQ